MPVSGTKLTYGHLWTSSQECDSRNGLVLVRTAKDNDQSGRRSRRRR
jgi:hypothetical protein